MYIYIYMYTHVCIYIYIYTPTYIPTPSRATPCSRRAGCKMDMLDPTRGNIKYSP